MPLSPFPGRAITAMLLVVLCLVAGVRSVSAEMVRFASGRTMTVEYCRFEGDQVVLVLRGGGEIRGPRSLVIEQLPDEVPPARKAADAALAASPFATAAPSPERVRALVDAVAERVGLDERLAHAVVQVESNYRPLAVSPRGAMGLMQIMPVVARTYDVADPFDPERNLEAGMKHLRRLLTRFDVRRALAAYNAGETAVVRYNGVPPYKETQEYVRRVMTALR